MDKPKEFWIFPQKGNDCEWTNLYLILLPLIKIRIFVAMAERQGHGCSRFIFINTNTFKMMV